MPDWEKAARRRPVYNAEGRLVTQQLLRSGQSLAVAGLPAGHYLVRYQDARSQWQTGRFEKRAE